MEFELRPWKEGDIDSLMIHADNYAIARFMRNGFPHPYTRAAGEGFIKFASESKSSHIFAISVNGEACGGIGLHQQTDIYEKNAELGYWLGEKYWRNGIVTRAVKQMVEYGFKEMPIERIYAIPFHTNDGSKKVLERAGFEHEATIKASIFKYGEYYDEWVYAIRRP